MLLHTGILFLFLHTASSFITIFPSNARELLLIKILNQQCVCEDQSDWCPFMKSHCTTNSWVKAMCLDSCYPCEPCEDGDLPTLEPEPEECDPLCRDLHSEAQCEFYKDLNLCFVFEAYCQATCEECSSCTLPYVTPPPCTNDCRDLEPTRNCEFWKTYGFCDPTEAYPNVPYRCMRTCNICTPC